MHQMATTFTDYLIKNEITDKEMREAHIYGIEVLLGKLVNYGTILLLAYLSHNLISTLFFMAAFFSLRGRTGGFHCDNAFHCYLGSILIFFFVTKLLTPLMGFHLYILLGCISVSGLVIYLLAPINHPSLGLDEREIKVCRSSSRWLVLLISMFILICIWLKIIPVYITYLGAGMALDAGLLIVAKIIKQEEKL